ncbi:ATP-binding cassette domain-containing protein [uncultured Parabacteroides sp.]|uniref:ATP-binding cassette domain-containing protein n=1 Tax=uncultured Parabacteroides sp. TaxID=512312 RepID=UPI002621DA50|nr:ATP-binding cassette domain-containing protein [uncultured Parabacteroides sp.]
MKLRKTITTIVATIILLAGWQLFAVIANQPELIPSLPQLVRTLCELLVSGNFYQSVGATILRGILGILISFICAIGMAGVFARFEWVYELFRPLLAIMRSIPVISFILLALIFLNPESIPLMIAFLTMFPLLTENLTRGILDLRPGLSIMARQFQIKRSNVLFQIIYPQLKPFLYSGLASATGFGWRAIIMGEVLSQCAFGIGSEMKKAQNFIAVPELLAWTIVAVFISFFFDKGISKISVIIPKISFASKDKVIPTLTLSALDTRGISYLYGIRHFSYSFQKGVIYGISAPSGKGKTTLLNLIGGILSPTEGEIRPTIHFRIATVFQEPLLLSHLTAEENIMFPLSSFLTEEKARQIAQKHLQEMEMEPFRNRYPKELSYGQQQRIAIARALTYPSPLLLMDEPFKGLDEALSHRIIRRIQEKQTKEERIILFTSHNPDEIRLLADEVIRL